MKAILSLVVPCIALISMCEYSFNIVANILCRVIWKRKKSTIEIHSGSFIRLVDLSFLALESPKNRGLVTVMHGGGENGISKAVNLEC